jgi:hypothetical protein
VSLADPAVYTEVQFVYVHKYCVGGVPVMIGRLTQNNKLGPVVYAAALNMFNLNHKQRGWGATQDEAVASLFRLVFAP